MLTTPLSTAEEEDHLVLGPMTAPAAMNQDAAERENTAPSMGGSAADKANGEEGGLEEEEEAVVKHPPMTAPADMGGVRFGLEEDQHPPEVLFVGSRATTAAPATRPPTSQGGWGTRASALALLDAANSALAALEEGGEGGVRAAVELLETGVRTMVGGSRGVTPARTGSRGAFREDGESSYGVQSSAGSRPDAAGGVLNLRGVGVGADGSWDHLDMDAESLGAVTARTIGDVTDLIQAGVFVCLLLYACSHACFRACVHACMYSCVVLSVAHAPRVFLLPIINDDAHARSSAVPQSFPNILPPSMRCAAVVLTWPSDPLLTGKKPRRLPAGRQLMRDLPSPIGGQVYFALTRSDGLVAAVVRGLACMALQCAWRNHAARRALRIRRVLVSRGAGGGAMVSREAIRRITEGAGWGIASAVLGGGDELAAKIARGLSSVRLQCAVRCWRARGVLMRMRRPKSTVRFASSRDVHGNQATEVPADDGSRLDKIPSSATPKGVLKSGDVTIKGAAIKVPGAKGGEAGDEAQLAKEHGFAETPIGSLMKKGSSGGNA